MAASSLELYVVVRCKSVGEFGAADELKKKMYFPISRLGHSFVDEV